jgi:hypothetical protein
MATKTITLEVDAYEKLRRAKRSDRESFSEVVRRARWDDLPPTGASILAQLRDLRAKRPDALLSGDALDRIEDRARTRGARPRPRAADRDSGR